MSAGGSAQMSAGGTQQMNHGGSGTPAGGAPDAGSAGTSPGGDGGGGVAGAGGSSVSDGGAGVLCGCSGDTCWEKCGGRCVDVAFDPNNCGACGHRCRRREDSCVDGECRANVCDDGAGSVAYLDCTDVPGCETPIDAPENCGGCGAHADVPANTAPDCTCDGPCDNNACQLGFGNCDHEQPDCETVYDAAAPSCMPAAIDPGCVDGGVRWTGAAFAADGAYYLMGWYAGTVDLDPSAGTDVHTPPSFVGENFLSKFDASGNYLGSHLLPGPEELAPRRLTMTPSGALAFVSVTDSGKSLGLLSGEGELLWLRAFPAVLSVGQSEGGLSALAVDAAGNLYVAGSFEGELDLDPGPGTLALASDSFAGFIASFTAAGELRWGRALTRGGNCTSFASALALRDNQLISVGSARGTCTFGADGEQETQLVAGPSGAAFIEPSDLDGNASAALFLNSTGQTVSGPPTQAGSVVLGDDGIYVAGVFLGQVDFDPGSGVNLRESAGPRTFVVKLTSDGALSWVRGIHGGASLALAPDGGVLAVGAGSETKPWIDGSFGWSSGPLSLTALNADGSAAWTIDPNAGSELGVFASNSEQIVVAGGVRHDCASPIARFAWPR